MSMYQANYELVKAVCNALGLKRCTSLRLDLDFEGLSRVTAELIMDDDQAREIKRIVEQYDLHPEKLLDEEELTP